MRPVYTEADLPQSGEFRIAAGGILTPAARDLAKTRGIRLIESGTNGVIAIGSDHGGFAMKQQLLPVFKELGIPVEDVGVFEEKAADYPDIAVAVARLVAAGKAERGVVIDGAGIGSAMAANKVPGIRAALCYDLASARNSREHNDANVLTLGGRLLTVSQAELVLRTWLATAFAGGRHQARIDKIMALERRG